MAHAGKNYPVHFRRDWSLDVPNYNQAAGRGYRFIAGDTFGTVGLWLRSNLVDCIAYEETSFQGLKWRSHWTPAAGRSIRVQMETSIANGFPGFFWRGEVIDSVKGTIGKFSGKAAGFSNYKIISGLWDAQFHPEPDLFGASTLSTHGATAMNWSHWNSL